jgi:hypothetical protein
MYAILLIVLIITLLEIYNLIPEKNKFDENENEKNKFDENENDLKFNEYRVKSDTIVLHYPGKILIKENYNIILKYKDESILMEKDIIYNMKDNFEIEIINIDNNDIYYYYTGS